VVDEGEAVVIRKIRYVSFESSEKRATDTLGLPYPVRLLAEAYATQLLAGHRQFPDADVFCYGNEVHIYLTFRNHPAFLRIDLAPPLRGGMVDLEYFGVSAYEHDRHPSPELPGITSFLRELGFQVTRDGTRVHARCDKESVLDLGTLYARAEDILRLTPYLMDLDWTIGSLDLDSAARATLIRSWADAFRDWGALPLAELMSDDRRGVLVGVEIDATGPHHITWSRDEPLRDRFNPAPPYDLPDALHAALYDLGIETTPPEEDDRWCLMGQMRLEKTVLKPLRDAVESRQLTVTDGGFSPAPPSLFVLEHETLVFAARLARGVEATTPMIAVARAVEPLERNLRFLTTGHVAGREVQRAILGLLGDELTLYVLRDARGRIRLALYSSESNLFRRRSDEAESWRSNACDDAGALALMLRRSNYQFSGGNVEDAEDGAEAAELLREISAFELPREPGPLPGERVVKGLPASPGRAVGRAVLTTEGREPQDLAGAVLVSASLGPEDTVALFHAAGVVSTGGGVLSHAGLIAIQFHKPALTVQGDWRTDSDGSRVMVFSAPEYREVETAVEGLAVVIRTDYRERQCAVREGDLLVANATLGTLRVLGQERTTLAIYDELHRLGASGRRLEMATDDSEVLTLRGHRVRSRHRLRRLLGDLEDPVVARWVVREMLLGDLVSVGVGGRADRAVVLGALLGNHRVGAIAQAFVERTAAELAQRLDSGLAEARRSIPNAKRLVEILQPRLDTLRLRSALVDAEECLAPGSVGPSVAENSEIDTLARDSLLSLRGLLAADLEGRSIADPHVRHLVRQLSRIDQVLPSSSSNRRRLAEVSHLLAARDDTVRRRVAASYVVRPGEGGLELTPLIGAKAANLAEIGRLLGNQLVPPWFAISDTAFREVLACTPPPRALEAAEVDHSTATLADAVEAVLANAAIGPREQSRRIRHLWDGIELPSRLQTEVIDAYHELTCSDEVGPAPIQDGTAFVALRSSSLEEDIEQATRAGEFDTFLFVSGRDPVIDYLKRTWSGLWTERAIHNRAAMRSAGFEGGGVLVQRIVWSRVSGVALTINVGTNDLHEIVINAGFGLGEGVVSGAVAADLITISKEDTLSTGTPRITYTTADKRSRVAFNRLAGAGTVLTETLFHQRLRPALEYVELRELVSVAGHLENAYGYPLDIEFAWEDHRLWILQARPVATFFAAFRDTAERFPLVTTHHPSSPLSMWRWPDDPSRGLARLPRRGTPRKDRHQGDKTVPEPARDAHGVPPGCQVPCGGDRSRPGGGLSLHLA
jgi:phosphohistidine swiveling domain-containing protein